MLSLDAKEAIRAQMARYPSARSALMPALYIAQNEAGGWLPPEAVRDVAEVMGMTAADVQAVASFYSMYYKQPVGRYVIDVCRNVSCALMGGRELLQHLLDRLGVAEGERTRDGLFTVKGMECLAACGGAPCLQVNGLYHENMSPEKAERLLEELRAAIGGTDERTSGRVDEERSGPESSTRLLVHSSIHSRQETP